MNNQSPTKPQNLPAIYAPTFLSFARPVAPVLPPAPSLFHEALHKQVAEVVEKEEKREARFRAATNTLPTPLAVVVLDVWDKIKNNVPGVLRVPSVCEREAGGALLTWNKEIHHLDVEITDDGALDFFYLNRETKTGWDLEVAAGEPLPDIVWFHLNYFRVVL